MKKAGGQAVIEGVMMMCGSNINTSVRKGNKIISKKTRVKKKNWFQKLLFIRGIVNLYDMLKIGMTSLIWSADQQAEKHEKISKKEIAVSLIMSFVLAVGLFIVLPLYLTKVIFSEQGVLFNIIDGIIRIVVFFIYLYSISLMKDIKRVFEYHGAEHKTVHCYEAGKSLTVENVKRFKTMHPRCGTSFIILVLIISIIVFSFITSQNTFYKLGLRILLLPVVAGISYEILKLADRFKDNIIFRIINYPGLLIQKITTREPSKAQIEVAIHSLKKVI